MHTGAVFSVADTVSVLLGLYLSAGSKWLLLTLFVCLLSVLCKEQGITVVAVCITYDLFIMHQVLFPVLTGKVLTVPHCAAHSAVNIEDAQRRQLATLFHAENSCHGDIHIGSHVLASSDHASNLTSVHNVSRCSV